jgi:hypothetical protein
LIEAWIATEDNEFYGAAMADEINKMMEVDVLCKLRELEVDDNDKVEDEDVEEEPCNARVPVTFEKGNGLAAQLKSLQVQASELGEEYHEAALVLNDASDHLWSACHKNHNAKVLYMARQSSMSAFIPKD